MDARTDRRMIAPLLTKHYPELANASSDEWHGFLNLETGMNISLDEPNPSAFDEWRKALADNGLNVWGISAARESAIVERAAIIKAAEDKRRADEQATLATLRTEAPLVTAKDLTK